MKKLANFLLVLLSIFILSGTIVNASEYVETGGAGYKVIEHKATNDLKFGVNHFIDISETKRDGSTYLQQVNVLEIPANSEAKIVSFADHSYNIWTLNTVDVLAKKFEELNPGWKVLAAVNGDFFDINGNGNLAYQTSNPLVTNGEYYKTAGSNAVGFKNDGSTNSLVGGTPKRSQYMVLAIYNEKDEIINEFDVHLLNTEPGAGQTAVFFGTYGADKRFTPANVDSVNNKYIVENADLALPNSATDFYGKGVITSRENMDLKTGQFGIVTNDTNLIKELAIGVKIRVQYEFVSEFADCDNITGQNAKFVNAGEYSPHPSPTNNTYARHPRTVAGIKADGTIVLSVIDGRQESVGRSGMYGNEMAAFMKSLGVVEAYNLDGGGSSYMVIRENGKFVITSNYSDSSPRKDGNALLVAVKVPHIEINVDQSPTTLDFNVDIVNDNGFDLNELYLKVGEITNKIIDGKTDFINLEPNTSYFYEFIYKNKSGKIDTLMIDGNIKTLKIKPEFYYIKLVEDERTFKISIEYSDPNNASNIKIGKIIINDKTFTLQDNQLLFLKSTLEKPFETFDFIYTYNDNANNHTVYIENAPYRFVTSEVTETLYEMFRIYNETILKIYSK